MERAFEMIAHRIQHIAVRKKSGISVLRQRNRAYSITSDHGRFLIGRYSRWNVSPGGQSTVTASILHAKCMIICLDIHTMWVYTFFISPKDKGRFCMKKRVGVMLFVMILGLFITLAPVAAQGGAEKDQLTIDRIQYFWKKVSRLSKELICLKLSQEHIPLLHSP